MKLRYSNTNNFLRLDFVFEMFFGNYVSECMRIEHNRIAVERSLLAIFVRPCKQIANMWA